MFEWLKRLFKRKPREEEVEFDWDNMESLKPDRSKMNLSDPQQMERYVRGCCDQMREATMQIEESSMEFKNVTEKLMDIEEYEQLPEEKRLEIRNAASELIEAGQTKEAFKERKNAMPTEQYLLVERYERDFPQVCLDLRRNEDYKLLVRQDLKNLEGEKISYRFRREELLQIEKSSREFSVITIVFTGILVAVLLLLQYQFKLQVKMGYLAAMALAAVGLTAMFIRFTEAKKERKLVEKLLNQAITVQNTVKIRYVNTTSLIDYTCSKYNVNSSDELSYMWERYMVEKKERENQKLADEKLESSKEKLLSLLRQSRIKDVDIWISQALALVDPREMVEIRHDLVVRRGSLRKRVSYNEESREEVKKELKELVTAYPTHADLIMSIVEEYE